MVHSAVGSLVRFHQVLRFLSSLLSKLQGFWLLPWRDSFPAERASLLLNAQNQRTVFHERPQALSSFSEGDISNGLTPGTFLTSVDNAEETACGLGSGVLAKGPYFRGVFSRAEVLSRETDEVTSTKWRHVTCDS